MARQIGSKKYSMDLCKIVYEHREKRTAYFEILPVIKKAAPEILLEDLPIMRDRWARRIELVELDEARKLMQAQNPIYNIGPQQVKEMLKNTPTAPKREIEEKEIFENPLSGDPSWREQYKALKFIKGYHLKKPIDYSQIKLIDED